jgi:predicted small lipoprotein YifL
LLIRFTMMRHLILSLLALLLCAACGVKGALEKPAGSVPPPLFDKFSNTAEPPPADADTSGERQE